MFQALSRKWHIVPTAPSSPPPAWTNACGCGRPRQEQRCARCTRRMAYARWRSAQMVAASWPDRRTAPSCFGLCRERRSERSNSEGEWSIACRSGLVGDCWLPHATERPTFGMAEQAPQSTLSRCRAPGALSPTCPIANASLASRFAPRVRHGGGDRPHDRGTSQALGLDHETTGVWTLRLCIQQG